MGHTSCLSFVKFILLGDKNLFNPLLIAVAAGTLPTTPAWSFNVALVMILSNLLAVVIGRYGIQQPGVGPGLPGLPALFTGFGIPQLIATACLGHILGFGFILGLASSGAL